MHQPNQDARRASAFLPCVVAVVLLLVATGGGVVAANATVFSAGSFVRVYLDALVRGDADGALALPGVRVGPLRTELLAATGLADDARPEVVSDVDLGGGRHRVTVAWHHDGRTLRTPLTVTAGASIGPFGQWRFATSPLATATLSITGGTALRVGGIRVDTAAVQRGTPSGAGFAVFAPGAYRVDLADRMLRTTAPDLVASRPGARVTAKAVLAPTARFRAEIRTQLHDALAACARQAVLFPPGCPFGYRLVDRLASPPVWSIADEPAVDLRPTATPGAWMTAPATGTAHLRTTVRALFDGKVADLDQDVPFTASWGVSLSGSTATLGALRTSG